MNPAFSVRRQIGHVTNSVVQLTRHAGLRAAALSFVLYLLGALYLLGPVLPHFGSAIPGSGVALVDGWQNTWNLWWVREALSRPANPYVTDMLFYPSGQSLYLHTLNITNALLTMPVQLVAGPIAAYNVALLLGFALTGLATYALALHIVGSHPLAFVAGALFTFSPFHIAKLVDGHLSWVTVFWIPLYILCLTKALDSGSLRWRVLGGVVLAGATFTSYYYALFGMIFTALLLLVRLPGALRARNLRSELVGVLGVGAVCAALVSPLLVPALREYRSEAQFAPPVASGSAWDRETSTYSADLLDMVFPSPFHPWWGAWAVERHAALRYGWFWTVGPGMGVLVLAVVGSVAFWRRARVWLALVVALWLLMLGPELRVAGVATGLPMPFDLLRVVPGMALGHRPNHFAIFLLPLLAALAGMGMQALWRGGTSGRVVLALLAGLVVVELLPAPAPAMHFAASPLLARVRAQPGAVMDLPNAQRNAPAMIDQMFHGQPIIGGYVARQPDSEPITANVPWVRQVWRLKPEDPADIVAQPPDAGRQAWTFYGLRTIVVRRQAMTDADTRNLRRALDTVLPGMEPAYRDALLEVYDVAPAAERRPLAYLGTGWHEREHDGAQQWRWMSGAATVQLLIPAGAPQPVALSLTARSYEQPRVLELALDEQRLAAFELFTPATRGIVLHMLLTPGEHTLRLAAPATRETAPTNRELSLMVFGIALDANDDAAP